MKKLRGGWKRQIGGECGGSVERFHTGEACLITGALTVDYLPLELRGTRPCAAMRFCHMAHISRWNRRHGSAPVHPLRWRAGSHANHLSQSHPLPPSAPCHPFTRIHHPPPFQLDSPHLYRCTVPPPHPSPLLQIYFRLSLSMTRPKINHQYLFLSNCL